MAGGASGRKRYAVYRGAARNIQTLLRERRTATKYCCPLCDFASSNQIGVRLHMHWRHRLKDLNQRIAPSSDGGLRNRRKCSHCDRWKNMKHILCGCEVALSKQLYTSRHDQVLKILREALSLAIARARLTARKLDIFNQYDSSQISVFGNSQSSIGGSQDVCEFYSQSESVSQHQVIPNSATQILNSHPGILKPAKDWVVICDFGNTHYKFPIELGEFRVFPDILAYSSKEKQVILIELTVPWEANMAQKHVTKTQKYAGLVRDIRCRGFESHFYAVEVGARGLVSKTFYKFLIDLGLKVGQVNGYKDRARKAALEYSKRLLYSS